MLAPHPALAASQGLFVLIPYRGSRISLSSCWMTWRTSPRCKCMKMIVQTACELIRMQCVMNCLRSWVAIIPKCWDYNNNRVNNISSRNINNSRPGIISPCGLKINKDLSSTLNVKHQICDFNIITSRFVTS